MIAKLLPGVARGSVAAPPSKSDAHRVLIGAALSGKPCVIQNVVESEDILATADCIRALGREVTFRDNTVTITDNGKSASDLFPCRESGSTLRFFLPIALLRATSCRFSGSLRLLERPQDVYEAICREQNLKFSHRVGEIEVCGPLSAGDFRIRGDLSSQFLTGLMTALPLLSGDSTITVIPPFASRPYVDLTIDVLKRFGIRIEQTKPLTYRIPGGQTYLPADLTVEGDWSNAAFLDVLNLLGGNVRVTGLRQDSLQGDRAYREGFQKLLSGCPTIDVTDTPDLAPVYMALGAALHGVTLTGTSRLRIKESDRGEAMAGELAKFGIQCDIEKDTIRVLPGTLKPPTSPIDGHNDHRVVMACTTLLTLTGGTITGAEAVRKSYPDYFETLRSLGMKVEIL